jgi:hypothetical protein
MNLATRREVLASAALVLVGVVAGCGEDNEKRASEDFKNTQTAPPENAKMPTKEEMQKRYAGGAGMYPGSAKKLPASKN